MDLKIGVITPWAVKCGIASYSKDLTAALAELGVDSYIVRLPRFGNKNPDILRNVVESVPLDRVDLVHVQHEYGLYQSLEKDFYGFLKRLDKPIVSTMHAVGNWSVDQVIYGSSDRIIVHNRFCSKNFVFPDTIIPHGCKTVGCPPPHEAKRKLDIPADTPIVGYCGFISTYKGIETLIDAMVRVPDAALLIAGGWHTGETTKYIIELKTHSLNLLEGRCQWLGYLPDEMLSTAYGAMDVVVYPSRFATESGALLNALGHGKAVLTSSLPPFVEKEEVGALMTFTDIEDLRKKIKELLADEETRRGFEERARSYAEANSWRKVAEKHIKLYNNISTI